MTRPFALHGATVFDGETLRHGLAVLVEDGRIVGVAAEIPGRFEAVALDGGILTAGFIDLQVNGGGGVMLNDRPGTDTLATIAGAHRRFGTTALLATLITADADTMRRAADAAAIGAAGVIGLHLEGPHLAPARKGAHDAALMRPLTSADVAWLIALRGRLEHLMVTLAPEQAPPAAISRLAEAGVIVSLGHSDCSHDQAMAAYAAGATACTHLFNAMSPLGSREPGLVGAALAAGAWCGIIADGHHVHPATLRLAIAANPGRLFLVTDAMATVGSDIDGFELGGRHVTRAGGRLQLADGTLAGADIDMAQAVRRTVDTLEVPVAEALRMASLYPARLLRDPTRGRIAAGLRAELLHLDDELQPRATWS